MRKILITYDLIAPNKDYEALYKFGTALSLFGLLGPP